MASEKILYIPKGQVREGYSKTIDIYLAEHQSQRHLRKAV